MTPSTKTTASFERSHYSLPIGAIVGPVKLPEEFTPHGRCQLPATSDQHTQFYMPFPIFLLLSFFVQAALQFGNHDWKIIQPESLKEKRAPKVKVSHTEAQVPGSQNPCHQGPRHLLPCPSTIPISVNLPPALSSVAWVPTFDNGDRKAPKNE